jgi:hypothetical protein
LKKIEKELKKKENKSPNRAKEVSNSLICGAKNVVEHYGKRIEIHHRHPFEG